MATPTITRHELEGALGPILVDVRSTSRTAAQPAVLIHHGFKGFKDYAFLPVMGERLARAGFAAVNVSVSGSGTNADGEFVYLDRFGRNTYTRELADLHAVIDALQRGQLGVPPPTRLGVIGHSRGGGVALMLTRETPAINALVTWSAISHVRRFNDAQMASWRASGVLPIPNARTGQVLPLHWEVAEDVFADAAGRFDIEAAARAITIPWLLVHGTTDETGPVSEGHHLASLATTAGFESRFIEGATHAYGSVHPWAGPTRATEELMGATVKWMAEILV